MNKMLTKLSWILRWFCVLVLLALVAVGWSTAQAARSGSDGLQGELSIGEVGARLGPSLPWLLGMEGPRTDLVLVQNSHELRATGGFIAAVGRVSVDGGRLTDFDFEDSYALYSDRGTYPPAPLPGPIADTYRAGDTFGCTLCFALGRRHALGEALAFAAREAAEVLTFRGPYRDESR